MKKIISFIITLTLAFSYAFGGISIYASTEEVDTPNLENATLLKEEQYFYAMKVNSKSYNDSSEHSPYGGYTLDYETNDIDDYHVYFVGITNHLFVKWLPKGETYFLQMTISMYNLNLDYIYRPDEVTGKLQSAESSPSLNGKQYYFEDFYATLFTDQDTIIVKNRQWMDMSLNYEKHRYSHTTRRGWWPFYSYDHFYNKSTDRDDISDYDNNSFVFRGGNSVLYNFDFSSIDKGPQKKIKGGYNRSVLDDIVIYNSFGIAFTSEIALNYSNAQYINASAEFIEVSKKINWGSIGVSFPFGISINPADLIGKKVTSYRARQDLQWKVI